MRCKSVVLSAVFVSTVFFSFGAQSETLHEQLLRQSRERQGKSPLDKKNEQPKSIWDDQSEVNPYFKSDSDKKTGTDLKEQLKSQKREPKRTTFKRRVYTGPSKEEIVDSASKKAAENFRSFLSAGPYDVRYKGISYNVPTDTLLVTELRLVPKKGSKEEGKVPYFLLAESVELIGYNIGEKDGVPMTNGGEMAVRKLEVPVWNDKGIKTGKLEASQLKLAGDVPTYLKAQGAGKLNAVELTDFRSEKIINETILNNIVRSKIFAASSAMFRDVQMQPALLTAVQEQKLSGLSFGFAQINGRPIPSIQGAEAAMTSYSARILNTDLVLGARLEAKKDKPKITMEQLKKNIAENKQALAAVDAEMDAQ